MNTIKLPRKYCIFIFQITFFRRKKLTRKGQMILDVAKLMSSIYKVAMKDVYVAIKRATHASPSGNLHNLTFSYLLERKEHHIKRIYADAYLSLFILKMRAM